MCKLFTLQFSINLTHLIKIKQENKIHQGTRIDLKFFKNRITILTHFHCRSTMSRFLMVHRKIMKLIKITITFFKIAYVDATKDVEEGIYKRKKEWSSKAIFWRVEREIIDWMLAAIVEHHMKYLVRYVERMLLLYNGIKKRSINRICVQLNRFYFAKCQNVLSNVKRCIYRSHHIY